MGRGKTNKLVLCGLVLEQGGRNGEIRLPLYPLTRFFDDTTTEVRREVETATVK